MPRPAPVPGRPRGAHAPKATRRPPPRGRAGQAGTGVSSVTGPASGSGSRSVNVLPSPGADCRSIPPRCAAGQAAGDRQAQSRAAALAGGVATVEAVEHEGLRLGGDALAGVPHRQGRVLAVAADDDVDAAARAACAAGRCRAGSAGSAPRGRGRSRPPPGRRGRAVTARVTPSRAARGCAAPPPPAPARRGRPARARAAARRRRAGRAAAAPPQGAPAAPVSWVIDARNSRRWRSPTSPSSSSRNPLSAAIGVFSSWDTLATRSRRARSRRRSSVTSRRVTTVPTTCRRRGANVDLELGAASRTTSRRSTGAAPRPRTGSTASRIAGGRPRGGPGRALGEPEQAVRGVVGHDDGAVRVDRQDALGQRPDHRPVAVALAGDLGDERLQARRHAVEPLAEGGELLRGDAGGGRARRQVAAGDRRRGRREPRMRPPSTRAMRSPPGRRARARRSSPRSPAAARGELGGDAGERQRGGHGDRAEPDGRRDRGGDPGRRAGSPTCPA